MRIATQPFVFFFLPLIWLAASVVHAQTPLSSNTQSTPNAPSKEKPADVVRAATLGVIGELSSLSKEERTETQIRRLVMTYIVPAIDQQKIAKGALGKHWRRASKEQRKAFINRFRDLQIRTYTGAFKAFNGEQFSFDDAKFNQRGDRALVKGKLIQNSGNPVPIDFRLYHNKKTQQWQIYDAVVAGLGMVKTYRQQLNERLQKISMEQLLAELQEAHSKKNPSQQSAP